MIHTLYYVYDPMCSWCYAFAKTFDKLIKELPTNIKPVYVVGGLAPHTNETMPQNMREKLQETWYQIENVVGTKFNHDFWTKCTPRRSTYLSCQATIAAKNQDMEIQMIKAIQEAYYQRAMNPSDVDTIILLAQELKLDIKKFKEDLFSKETIKNFNDKMNLRRKLHLNSFPSLALKYKENIYLIDVKFNEDKMILKQIEEIVKNIDS